MPIGGLPSAGLHTGVNFPSPQPSQIQTSIPKGSSMRGGEGVLNMASLSASQLSAKFIRQCINPLLDNILPPSERTRSAVAQKVSITGKIIIDDPKQFMYFIWFKNFGYNNFGLYESIQNGSKSAPTGWTTLGTETLVTDATDSEPVNLFTAPGIHTPETPAAGAQQGMFGFRVIDDKYLYVPVASVIPGRADRGNVQVGPTLESNYAEGRNVSGVIQVYTTGSPVLGTFSVSGTLTAAALSDIRDIGQISEQNLKQLAVTADDFKQVEATTGLVLCLGPDIGEIEPLERTFKATEKSGYKANVLSGPIHLHDQTNQSTGHQIVWIAPFTTLHQRINGSGSGVSIQNLQVDDIGPLNTLSFEVESTADGPAQCTVIHVFCQYVRGVGPSFVYQYGGFATKGSTFSGALNGAPFATTQTYGFNVQLDAVGSTTSALPVVATSIPQGFPNVGFDAVVASQTATNNVPGVGETWPREVHTIRSTPVKGYGYIGSALWFAGGLDASAQNGFNILRIGVFAENLYAEGSTGPVTVGIMEGAQAGQTLNFIGDIVEEATTLTSKRPFSKEVDQAIRTTDTTLLPLLQVLWNSDVAVFARVYRRDDYQRLLPQVAHWESMQAIFSEYGSDKSSLSARRWN